MKTSFTPILAAALIAAAASAGCGGTTVRGPVQPALGAPASSPPAGRAGAVAGPRPYSAADVHFMTGMIPHHAQAVLVAGWAATHGASAQVRLLCERIIVAQRDEIELMRSWLRDRDQMVPDADATRLTVRMHGAEHEVLMPGMLSAEELAQLDSARGPEFDRLFLTFMIRHHEGALTMVEQLFNSYGAAQDETVFRFGSDVLADQTAEIERMQQMLDALTSGSARRDPSPPSSPGS
ncbi:MAG: DUF305 domain-containing protein [Gemmatimonadetes bacterium]|nr:DUF305 domain-containing protein [Gemmatimonadota bacterium]